MVRCGKRIGIAVAVLCVPLLGLYWFFSGSIPGALVLHRGHGSSSGSCSRRWRDTPASSGWPGVVCCAAGVAGDMLQDLKVGHILGGTPWKMEVGEIIGVIVAALVLIVPMMARQLSTATQGDHA